MIYWHLGLFRHRATAVMLGQLLLLCSTGKAIEGGAGKPVVVSEEAVLVSSWLEAQCGVAIPVSPGSLNSIALAVENYLWEEELLG